MAALNLVDIEKNYGDFVALKRLSLSIPSGEFVCFLGPSGCGKTTLLRLIAGLDRQSAGRVEIDGRDLSHAPPAERDYGIVFQSYALFPNLTIAANIAYGLIGKSKNERRARVSEMLELVGLPGIEGKYPGQLSGGQQQRVALARALAPSPKLLLLDEPLSALDARVRLTLRQQICALHRRLGLTTIMVTHDQEEALTMADRIVVMNHGTIEQSDTPRAIYARPASRFVAEFVGTMNLLPAEILATGRVRIGAIELGCADNLPLGPVTLAFRPEDVELDPVATVNRLTATLESLEFLGPYQRARLRLDGLEQTLLADFSAHQIRTGQMVPGQTLSVGVAPERLLLLAAT